MEETKPEPTPQELDKLGYADLVEIAKRRGINYAGLNVSKLKMAVGAAPEGAVIVDLKEGMPDFVLNQLKEERKLVPGKIIYPKELEDKIWDVRERNPVAFDSVNFLDKNAPIQHTFTKRTKCVCGETVVMERRIKTRRDREMVETVDPTPVFKKQCKCGIWYIYHPKEDVEIHGPIL